MAVNARESVLQGTRLFVIAATGLDPTKVLVDRGAGLVRPALPYATVQALTPGVAVGQDEVLHDLLGTDGAQREWVRGHRRATVQVTVFGAEAPDYLEAVRTASSRPSKRAATTTASYAVSICRVLTPRDATVELDTGFEVRSVLDLEVAYRLETVPANVADSEFADTVAIGLTLTGPTGDLVATVTQDIPVSPWDLGASIWDSGASDWDR